jgi:hypothetical protein
MQPPERRESGTSQETARTLKAIRGPENLPRTGKCKVFAPDQFPQKGASMRSDSLIRVSDTIIDLDKLTTIDIGESANGKRAIVFRFSFRGYDELDKGTNIAQPYQGVFQGEEAGALRGHLIKLCPDLLASK